jgi:hypothetical protein
MKHTHKLRPIAVACMALASEVTFAQTPPAADATLPEVKVRDATVGADYNPAKSSIGGGVDTPLRDIPQSVTVINSTLMQAQGATSLADALRNVPGITMGAAEGGSIGNNFNLRGFSARNRSLSRRDARSRAVLPRRLLTRCGRGAAGPVVDAVRPRVDRRRDQPSEQSPDPAAIRHCDGDRRHAALVPGYH